MQVKELNKEELRHEYEVVVPADTINEKMESQLKTIGERVKIPGFRPGHIPVKVLKQRYGKSVMGEVLEKTVNQTSQQVLKDKELKPALPPKIEIVSYNEGESLTYKMTTELLPDIPQIDFSAITLERPQYELDDSEIDEALQQLAKANRSLEKKEKGAKAQNGNVVNIDFTGKKDGEPFSGGAATGHNLELGSGQFIPGFEEQLVGVKEGDELVVKVTFPEDYHSEELAGQPVEFNVVVNAVHEVKVPAADDKLAKDLGMEDLEALRKMIRERLEGDYNKVVRAKLKKQLFDYLEENVDFAVPPGMLEMEFNSIWEKLQQAIKDGDPSVSDRPEDELREEYMNISRRRVKLGLILSNLAEKENIRINQDELSRAVLEQAQMFPGQEQKIFEFYQKNPQQLEELRGPILEDKAVDVILGKVKYNDVKVTVEELLREDDDEGKEEKSVKGKTAGKKKTGKKKNDSGSSTKKTAKKSSAKKSAAKETKNKKTASQ